MKFKKSISFVLTLCMVLSLFATFVIPVAAEGPASGISVPEDVTLFEAPYAGVDVLVDGDTAEGKFGCFYGNQAYLVAVMNTNAEANVWDVTIALKEETTFNTVTVYYWDEANSCIHMPTTTTVTVNGKTYTVENTTESEVGADGKVHAVVVDLGEDVTASSYTVSSTMAADQANFFNMMTEVAVSYVVESGISVPEDVTLFEAPYAGVDVLVDGDTADGKFGCFYGNQAYLVAVMNTNAEANVWDVTIALKEETTFNTVTVYYWDEANSCIHMPTTTTVTVNGKTYTVENTTESEVGADGKVHAVAVDLGEDVTASYYTVSSTMAADQANFFNMMTEVAVSLEAKAEELPEEATGLDIYGYTHTAKNYVMYVDADMTLGELTNKYYGSSKDLNYFKVIVVNEDGTVAATYLTLGREPAEGPNGIKSDIAVTKGQVVLALSANEANVGRFEIAETVNVGDIVTLYNVDFTAENNTELTNAGFTVEAAKVPTTSQVVENFNHADWNTGINTFHAAYIFTDAEIYAGVGMAWWYHASFAPTANGAYVVVEVAAPGSDAATKNSLVIPEGGFVWVAWTSAESGNGKSSGAYAKGVMSNLKAGDIVLFNGLDIANLTTAEDASAEVLAPAADMDLIVSHNYNYNWHCFETQIITMAVGEANLKKAGDAPNMSAEDTDILYIVELVDGAYKVTGIVGGKALVDVEIPEGGFLYYVTKNCTGYDKICHGELIGKYFLLGDIDLATKFAIDTSKDSGYTMQAVSGFKTGDLNLNGEIDATDYAILRKLVLGTLTAEDIGDLAYGVADVNGDKVVNARDYYLVKRAFLGTYVIPGWETEEEAE